MMWVLATLAACEAVVLVVLYGMWRDAVEAEQFWFESSCRGWDIVFDHLDELRAEDVD